MTTLLLFLLFLLLWAVVSVLACAAWHLFWTACQRRNSLDARLAPHVASDLDERIAVGEWPRRSR